MGTGPQAMFGTSCDFEHGASGGPVFTVEKLRAEFPARIERSGD